MGVGGEMRVSVLFEKAVGWNSLKPFLRLLLLLLPLLLLDRASFGSLGLLNSPLLLLSEVSIESI